MRIKIYPPLAIQELGNRDNQEDYIYPVYGKATAKDHLFIVCDGMGGHENGEVASQTFAEALADFFNTNASPDGVLKDSVIAAALDHAYSKLDAADNGNYKKMGTTLTLLYFHRGGVTAAHIGDSRIYHLRPGKKLLYVSRDHSLVFDLYQSGEITYGEMKTSLQKNVITRAVQPGEDNRVKPDIIHITDVKPGDYFYLCSDGMLERMDDDDVFKHFSSRGDDEKKLKKLIDATAMNQDNHSAYIIHVDSVTMESDDENITVNEESTARFNVLNMKPISGNSVKNDDEEDNDSTVVASSTPIPQPELTTRPKKKQSSWIWWALLIAAIVTAAVWLALYGWGGRHEKESQNETTPMIENNSVHNEEPVKPTIHHSEKPHRAHSVVAVKPSNDASPQSTMESDDASKKGNQAANANAPDNEQGSENN